MIFQILPASEGIGKASGGGIGHGIDGKIPPGQVFFDVRDEFHPFRVPVVPVIALGAEGGDLYYVFVQDHRHGAVLFAVEDQGISGENGFGLLRQGIGAEVVVVGGQSQNGIPDAAAHGPGLKARPFQGIDTGQNIIRQEHRFPPPAKALLPGAQWSAGTQPPRVRR